MLGVTCKVKKMNPYHPDREDYCFNGRWKIIRGQEWFVNGEFHFPPIRDQNPENIGIHRTLYGWNIAHDGVIYEQNDTNLRLAMRRHFAKVRPDYKCSEMFYDAFDGYLRRCGKAWFRKNTAKMVEIMRPHVRDREYTLTLLEGAEDLITQPHPKQKLRIDALTEAKLNDMVARKVWLVTQLIKLKPDEIAKLNKYGRVIFDMGVLASLQSVPFGNHVKDLTDGKLIRYKDCEILFLKSPKPSEICQELFNIWESKCKIKALIFSDDAVVGVLMDGVWRVINCDLSSNDSCKFRELYDAFFLAYECPREIKAAITGQIESVCRMMSLDNDICVLIKNSDLFLPSGLGITSQINTWTWFCIIVEWADKHAQIRIPHDLIKLAENVGHKVTLDICEIPEDMQFLKHSPILSAAQVWTCVLNLGVVFRASGVCRGDLPGRGDCRERAKDFQHSLMHGLLRGIDYAPIRKLQPSGRLIDLRDKVPSKSGFDVAEEEVVHQYTSENFYKRYRLTPTQICQLEEEISWFGYGSVLYSRAASAVLQKDYGLTTPLR